ncbi:glycosyltransferase [Micromonospora musae]|uniref:glycosyltransferase n=1 Tax=Micromonospora musae TaxID=1894970 RepID=UPI0033E3D29D
MFSAPPSVGHLLPILPTLQALRAGGHDVLVAAYGGQLGPYLKLGLSVVDVGDEVGLTEMYEKHAPGARFGDPGDTPEQMFRVPSLANAGLSRRIYPRLRELTDDWGPDLLLYDPFQGAVPLISAIMAIPAVEHQTGLVSGRTMTRLIGAHLGDLYERHSLEVPVPAGDIEIGPPSLRAAKSGSFQARYISSHGSALLPADLTAPSNRARVLVSFGTVLSAEIRDAQLAVLLPVLGRVDAEFLLPAGDRADVREVKNLPGNVRLLPWAPLTEVLQRSDAVIHHGGAGTLMGGVVAGVPQLIVPHFGDQFANARIGTEHGFAVRADSVAQIDETLIDRLLNDVELRRGAGRVRAENERLPPPSDLVPQLEMLVER